MSKSYGIGAWGHYKVVLERYFGTYQVVLHSAAETRVKKFKTLRDASRYFATLTDMGAE